MLQLLILPLFSPFGLIVESIKEFWGYIINSANEVHGKIIIIIIIIINNK
jgi:hypothetical protein